MLQTKHSKIGWEENPTNTTSSISQNAIKHRFYAIYIIVTIFTHKTPFNNFIPTYKTFFSRCSSSNEENGIILYLFITWLREVNKIKTCYDHPLDFLCYMVCLMHFLLDFWDKKYIFSDTNTAGKTSYI